MSAFDTRRATLLASDEGANGPFREVPTPTAEAGRRALRALIQQRNILAALRVFHEELGDVFGLSLGAFKPVFMVGPEACRYVLVTARHDLLWRPGHDPVAKLLRHGLLVEDGESHDTLRRQLNPSLHRKMLGGYVEAMWRDTDLVTAKWSPNKPVDMLVEMRRVALLIVMETLFKVDIGPDLERLFPAILTTLRYISPGLWTVWPGIPRPGFRRALRTMDDYLYRIIAARRETATDSDDDMLGLLVNTPGMSDDLIRDQLLTILIAGHDTSTALLAWALYLLGKHPEAMQRLQAEVDAVLGDAVPTLERVAELTYLEQVIDETMRLYPPIHIGNRIAARDLYFEGYHIPAGTRVVYSIYLTHRH
ncbi:MAG: cytochrome P450, partial [Anaerolineae bacterium]